MEGIVTGLTLLLRMKIGTKGGAASGAEADMLTLGCHGMLSDPMWGHGWSQLEIEL